MNKDRTVRKNLTLKDIESMTPSQLSELTLKYIMKASPGSYTLSSELFDLIDHLDRTVQIAEDSSLEKYLHLAASLVLLTEFQGRVDFNVLLPAESNRLARHLERIVGPALFKDGKPQRIYADSLMTEPSLQIATFLAYPLLEGVIRRKLSEFISLEGKVAKPFQILGGKREKKKTHGEGLFKPGYQPKISCARIEYDPTKRKEINRIDDELRLLKQETKSSNLKAKLSYLDENRGLFDEIQDWRWQLSHGVLTASWHSLALLLLTYLILLE
jgi:hypothetical protein